MKRGKEFMVEAKGIREARESLDEVRRPWYLAKAPAIPIICSMIGLLGLLLPLVDFAPTRWSYLAGIGIVAGMSFLNQRYRDRAWRRLIEHEAPQLHQKILRDPDA